MVWLFHCSNKANHATSLFPHLFYFNSCLITTPASKHNLCEECPTYSLPSAASAVRG